MAYDPSLGTPDIRRLNLASDPATQLDFGSRAAGQVSQSAQEMTPYQKFNLEILNMLKQAQQVGTGKFREAELTGIEKQAQAGYEDLPADIAGLQLNPQQIAEYRRQRQAPFQPGIEGSREMRKTLSEQISGLGDTIQQARLLGQLLQQEETDKRKEAIDLITKAPSAVKAMGDNEKKELAKRAGITIDFIDAMPDEQEKWTETTLSDGSLAQRNSKTGEIKILIKGSEKAGKQLPSNQVVMLSDSAFLPGVLDDLKNLIETNADLFGPTGKVKGLFARTKLGTTEDDLRRAAQLVGKFMEGGVLRKEDEIKYEKMLPNLKDWNTKVALDKLDGIKKMLEKKYDGYVKSFQNSGYDVSGFQDNPFGTSGEIPVRVIDTGEVGWISEDEFDPEIYEKLNL